MGVDWTLRITIMSGGVSRRAMPRSLLNFTYYLGSLSLKPEISPISYVYL